MQLNSNILTLLLFKMSQTTVKSRSGNTFGAIKVQIYSNATTQEITTLTQNPKLFDMRVPVVRLADVQFVTSMPI